MSKNKFLSKCILLLFLCACFTACSNEEISKNTSNQENTNEETKLKASIDNYFDFEAERLNMIDLKGNLVKGILVPWVRESPNAGVSSEWIDHNFHVSGAKRMYTKSNGWELVYSNILEKDSYKYIGLYNKYTGILRFFVYIFADPGNQGSSQSVWGISVNKQTSLMNFNKNTPLPADKPDPAPATISTTEGTFSNGKFTSIGLANNTWYAFEIECAYAPETISDSSYFFTIMGRAINKITTEGTATTTGEITGTIKATASSSSSPSVSFSNMFNNTLTNTISATSNTGGYVGDKIDQGIKKNDPFFKSLWSNIKSNASKWVTSGLESGAKKGIESIISSGSSLAVDALKGLLGGLIGDQDKVSKVDLKVQLDSKIKMESEQILAGQTDRRLAIPGGPDKSLLYNKPLGVWNLKTTPVVTVHSNRCIYYVDRKAPTRMAGMKFYFTYSIENYSIILNPEIEKEFNISGPWATILVEGTSQPDTPLNKPYGYIVNGKLSGNKYEDIKFYTGNTGLYYETQVYFESTNGSGDKNHHMSNRKFKVYISFNITHKTNGKKYSFSKMFDANREFKIESTYNAYLNEGNYHPEWGSMYD